MQVAIRLSLTAAILFVVYQEAGPWTALAIGSLPAANEMTGIILRRHLV